LCISLCQQKQKTMKNTVKEITIAKNVKIVNQSVYGWFYEKGMSVKMLHNIISNSIAIVVPNENFHVRVKLSGTSRKSEATLLKLYAKYCEKFNVANIFA
jgi:hypothetical protein